MASLAESSIASVPHEKLAELKQQLAELPQRSGASAYSETLHHAASKAAKGPLYFDASDDDVAILDSISISTGNISHAGKGAAAAVNRKQSRAALQKHSNRSPPQLPLSRSAPAGGEMETMIQQSPSEEAFLTLTKGVSFHGYPGGDTQPMESQVYRQYHESVTKSNHTTPQKVRIKSNGDVEREGDLTTEVTLGTLQEGDTGFVDLAFQPRSPSPGSQDEADYEEQLVSSQLGSQRPAYLQTPAIAGHKHGRDGRILLSEPPTTTTKTPDFSRFFGNNNAPVMSATQLFNQTQAPSSPLPDFPRSDPVVTRPSPNVRTAGMTSPPPVTTSSPVFGIHSRPSPAPGEPRSTYMSMKESQERRKMRSSVGSETIDAMQDADDGADEFDLMLGTVRRGVQRVTSDPVLKDRVNMDPPEPQSRRSQSPIRERAMVDLVTPLTRHKITDVRFASNLSRDNADQQDTRFNAETGLDGDEDGEEDNDIYDELSGSIMKSQRDRSNDSEEDLSAYDDEMLSVTHDEGPEEQGPGAETPLVQQSSVQGDMHLGLATGDAAAQHMAVANSLPGTPQTYNNIRKGMAQEPPSTGSVVPGSQYIRRPSAGADQHPLAQEQALVDLRKSSAMQKHRSSQPDKVSSSPPQIFMDDTVADNSAEASATRRQALKKTRAANQHYADLSQKFEIPESDAVEKERLERSSEHDQQTQMNAQTTATTVTGTKSPPRKRHILYSPVKPSQSQRSRITDDTPRKAAGIPHFKDLPGGPNMPALSKDTSMDLDSILGDVFTAEDQQVIAATSSPPRAPKRRRLESQPSRRRASITLEGKPVEEPLGLEGVARQPLEQNQTSLLSATETHGYDRVPRKKITLRDSPARGNELPSATPPIAENLPSDTPESVRLREVAGAQAVSQLLTSRFRRRAQPKPARNTGTLRKPKRRRPVVNSSGEVEGFSTHDQAADTEQSYHTAVMEQVQAQAGTNADTEQTPYESAGNASKVTEEVADEIVAPTRIFGHFGGRYNNYYPSTWLSSSLDGFSHKVRFDDNAITILPKHAVRRLELRLGDQVKVDVKGMRNNVWLVRGFANLIANKDQHGHGVDVHGFRTVKVQAKAARCNPGGAAAQDEIEGEGEGDIIDVAIQAIYLTPSMWHRFDREFVAPSTSIAANGERLSTPVTETKTPLETPGSRNRRPNSALVVSRSHLREGSVASSTSRTSSGLFSGMKFAISYSSNDAEKAQVTRQIKQNGGTILESGFEELFVLPHFSKVTGTSPPKRQNASAAEAEDELSTLQIHEDCTDVGFAALIADRHSRRAKYMQALALGLPTLSGKWIIDSVAAASGRQRNSVTQEPLAWFRYLLASGESAYLSGAVRSRMLTPYSAAEAKLANIISTREILLDGDGVLIVTPKKGKHTWEKTKAYAFLTLAIGAGRVKLVSDLDEARVLTGADDGRWKWVYVDGTIAEARAEFLGNRSISNAAGQTSKKRKRISNGKRDVGYGSALSAGDHDVRIVNDEFVVQSLILGALVE
ncbi:hypothetical protein K431DRAFT_98487 [Polychaeton citri CBS 116435]|uniref:BRCT domain-containing protein n=1 Tax=Polychaeton citri CBS 116435 TaxID=1314669 RepID=A0A9P4USL5_9PEZI|nr:hypothetical protein K431DRAFT_98487 [Polychaeton citri CBS 116435]